MPTRGIKDYASLKCGIALLIESVAIRSCFVRAGNAYENMAVRAQPIQFNSSSAGLL